MDPGSPSNPIVVAGEEDEELRKTLALSLQDHQPEYDEQLKQALALSMQENAEALDSKPAAKPDLVETSSKEKPAVSLFQPLSKESIEACYATEAACDVAAFHNVMWDATMTTDSDRNRWVNQSIGFQESTEEVSRPVEENLTEAQKLEWLSKSHQPWGLVQQHGGPCGVLAAIQAELVRILVWGESSHSFLSADHLLECLARSIGCILARAALADAVDKNKKGSVQESAGTSRNHEGAKLVIPSPAIRKECRALGWSDFEPWPTSASSVTNSTVVMYTVPFGSDTDRSIAKRHKGEEHSVSSASHDLGDAIASFLLEPDSDGISPICHFTREGGVLLLVLSLVASRCSVLNDFDDESSRLTAQFGHCSQELMNLLLTGQAVSNVFDNTMSPSGDIVLSGIGRQSTVGYLSQLEALRYCQVGSYYKSPKSPVWVVGSTSHFTVIFGSSQAIEESESDLLLEKCRRVFKSVDRGDEDGFIQASSLGLAMEELGLSFDAHHISLLVATLEVSGAGIILWDDFWKATSRLLSGASIESVTSCTTGQQNHSANPTQNAVVNGSDEEMAKRLASSQLVDTSAGLPAETDEEMARRLANEWGTESDAQSMVAVQGDVDSTADDMSDKQGQHFEFERYGKAFNLFHYNGLRSGVLTPFRITRLTPEEAVGASIALSRASDTRSQDSTDLESVVRTKWPSSAVNWLGKPPPFID